MGARSSHSSLPFAKFGVATIDGATVSAIWFSCDFCPQKQPVACANDAPRHLVRRKAESAGWTVLNDKKARCATCSRPKRSARVLPMQAKEKEPVSLSVVNKPALTEMAKFRILCEVRDNWDEKRSRYLDDASDVSIGKKFNVGWAVVQEVRESVFGKIKGNIEIERLETMARDLLDGLGRLDAEIVKVKTKMGL